MVPHKASYNGQPVIKQVYIECGVWMGGSLIAAAKHHPVCHGIEVVPAVAEDTRDRIRSQGVKNATIHIGKSVDILPKLIDVNLGTTFFLDSHYTAAQPRTKPCKEIAGTECPLIEEIKLISSMDWQAAHMIVVDDWFMFTEDFWESDQRAKKYVKSEWPTDDEIREILCNYEYELQGKRRGVFTNRA